MPVTPANPTMIRVYRDEISRHLIDEAKRLHPEAITFHFEAGIIGADLDKRVVSISGQGPTEVCPPQSTERKCSHNHALLNSSHSATPMGDLLKICRTSTNLGTLCNGNRTRYITNKEDS